MATIVRKVMLSGWRYQPKVEHMVEIEIDETALLLFLGDKAMRNKSKKSKMQGGMITCKIRLTQAAKEAAAQVSK